jgi:predicted PurR-regulated permease PerM
MIKKKQKKNISMIDNIKSYFGSVRNKLDEIRQEKERELKETTLPSSSKKEQMIVELNPASVAKSAAIVLLILILFYFFYEIRGILLIVFISFLLAAALDPLVDRMQGFRIPRSVSVLLIYIVLILLTGIFVTKIVTLIADQVVDIAQSVGDFVTKLTSGSNFPFAKEIQPYLDQFYKTLDLQTAASQIQNALQIVAGQLLSISVGLLNLLIILIMTFFMTVEEKAVEDFYSSLLPSRYTKYVATRMSAAKDQIGYWIRGQVMVSLISTIITYIGLIILGVDYALTLSVIAGISMVIPVIGRVFAWAIAFPIVFNQAPWLSLWMSLFYLALQQVENNVIVPYVMNKAVGLSPIIIIIAMMIGGQYLGILGLVLAIPIATTAAIFVKDYALRSK